MFEATEELVNATRNKEFHINDFFDTIEKAEQHISECSINQSKDGGDSFEEVFYTETTDFPKELKGRNGVIFSALRGWTLDSKD